MTWKPSPENWAESYKRFGSAEHLHALGAVAVAYNLLEDNLFVLFRRYIGGRPPDCHKIFVILSNNSRLDLLRKSINEQEKDNKVKNALLAWLLGFDICAENRNVLMHSLSYGQLLDVSSYTFSKWTKTDAFSTIEYRLTAQNIREIADTTVLFAQHIDILEDWFKLRDDPSADATPELGPLPFPQTLPRPRKLSLICREVSSSEPHPPQPSDPSPQPDG